MSRVCIVSYIASECDIVYESQSWVILESLVFGVVVDIMRASAWYNNLYEIIRSRYAIASYRLLICIYKGGAQKLKQLRL